MFIIAIVGFAHRFYVEAKRENLVSRNNGVVFDYNNLSSEDVTVLMAD